MKLTGLLLRWKRIPTILAAAGALAMALAVPAPAAAGLGDTQVTIDCQDGSPIYTTVSPTRLTRLAGTVQSMVEAGQPCNLRQENHEKNQEASAFIIGSGIYGTADGCPNRFTIKAHMDEDGAHGIQTFKFVGTDPLCTTGSLRANVTCVSVAGNVGEARGIVQEAEGGNITDFAPEGTVFATDATDSPDGTRDMVTQRIYDPATQHACAAQGGIFPLDRGHIEVGTES